MDESDCFGLISGNMKLESSLMMSKVNDLSHEMVLKLYNEFV